MPEIQRIEDQLRRAYQGEAWHGPATRDLLHGVDARSAAARPIPGAHSIWEIVLHLTAWVREVGRRVGGAQPALPAEGDWPPVPAPTPGAWSDAQDALAAAHLELWQALGRLGEADLDRPVGTIRDAPLGSGVTYYGMLHGLAQHDAYHGGQIALLKKAIAG